LLVDQLIEYIERSAIESNDQEFVAHRLV
jgi:hypothetical protein